MKPNKETITTIRVTPEMKKALEELARKEDRSVSSLIRLMIQESLKKVTL